MGFNFDQNKRRGYKTPALSLKKNKRVSAVQRTPQREEITEDNITFLKSLGYKIKHVK